jgi:solute carrier family 38 (sodium-coupled neutral amino acid transporter), member 7/8
VTDLGAVLHMIGGTAAAFIIFFLPGLLLVNAAIVKLDAPPGHTVSGDLDAEAPLLVRRCGMVIDP